MAHSGRRIPLVGFLPRPGLLLVVLGLGTTLAGAGLELLRGEAPAVLPVAPPAPAEAPAVAGSLAGLESPVVVGSVALVDDREIHVARLHDLCRAVTGKLASVALSECVELGLGSTGAASVEGWPIVLREYPPLAARVPRGRVLVIGGIHGDEYSSVSVVFKWMWILDRFHSGLFHWHIAPLVNPDGLLRHDSQRTNANGVDLNRNFPTSNWEEESENYWVLTTHRNPRRYPGRRPLSEPEASWLVHEIESFAPDVIVSVHAPARVVDFDGPPHAPQRLGSLILNPLGTYPGSLGRYAGINKAIPVVTIELASAGVMPSRDEYTSIWVDLVAWLKSRLPETRMVSRQVAGVPGPGGRGEGGMAPGTPGSPQ